MKLFKTRTAALIQYDNKLYETELPIFDEYLNNPDLLTLLHEIIQEVKPTRKPLEKFDLAAPMGMQNIWAAGVTYERSKVARKDESKEGGHSDFYEKVYHSERPELFYKASPYMVAGPDQLAYIRRDSRWNVPEPEITLFLNSAGKILAITAGNDISARDIEGENPLYLPQAKSFMRSAALGPCLKILDGPIDLNTGIKMKVSRRGKIVFSGETYLNRMKRTFEELSKYLFSEMEFPNGVFLMTGTGIVPPNDFTLIPGDTVKIEVDGIGELDNPISYNIHKPGNNS